MLAVVFALKKWRYFLHGVVHKTILHSDHQNLTYFKIAVVVNRRQSRCAEELVNYNFNLFLPQGKANSKANTVSMSPAFTVAVGGSTATQWKTLLRKKQ